MRIHTLAIAAMLAAGPALAQTQNNVARTGPSPTSGSDVGPFKPGNPILNPIEVPRDTTAEPTSVLVVPPMTAEQALAAERAARSRAERTERSMDRVEAANERTAAARAALTPPPIAGAFTGSTDPRDR